MTTPGALAAHDYAKSLDWKLIPIWWANADGSCGCGQQHLDNPKNRGKHPITSLTPRGLIDATSNVAEVDEWFRRYPDANIAVNCRASGLVVIDVDPRNGGEKSWAEIVSSTPVPSTLRASTGGGGFHLFYRDKDLAGQRPRGKLAPGVDIKWDGYVLLSPSNHLSGGKYSWDTNGIAPAHLGEFAASLRQTQAGSLGGSDDGSVVDLESLFEGVSEGSRHDTFKSFVARLRSRRYSYVEARLLIEGAWARVEQNDLAPFPLDEALRLLDWAWSLPAGTPEDRMIENAMPFINSLRGSPAAPGLGTGGQPVTNASGIGPTGEPYTNGHSDHLTVADRLLSLPDGLRELAIKQFMQDEARRTVKMIRQADDFHQPRGHRLDELLLYGVPEPEWTIDGLHERGTNMSLTAQFKTGKTTLQLNMLKALADCEPFLGMFQPRCIDGNIAFFNYELTDAQFVRWVGRLRIAHPEKIYVLNMRGLRLDLQDEYTFDWVTTWLRQREIEFWFIDPLARAYYGDENDNTMLKQWTDRVDEIKEQSGVVDCQVSLHTGRGEQEEGNERARGATRIDDWVDGRMILTRQREHRFFRAEGREVDVPEMMLVFNPEEHRLEVSNMMPIDRGTARRLDEQGSVEIVLREAGAWSFATGITRNQLIQGIGTGRREAKIAAIEGLVAAGVIGTSPGARGAIIHWLIPESERVQPAADTVTPNAPPPPAPVVNDPVMTAWNAQSSSEVDGD